MWSQGGCNSALQIFYYSYWSMTFVKSVLFRSSLCWQLAYSLYLICCHCKSCQTTLYFTCCLLVGFWKVRWCGWGWALLRHRPCAATNTTFLNIEGWVTVCMKAAVCMHKCSWNSKIINNLQMDICNLQDKQKGKNTLKQWCTNSGPWDKSGPRWVAKTNSKV